MTFGTITIVIIGITVLLVILFLLVLLVKVLAPIFVGLIILVNNWCRIVDIYENKAALMENVYSSKN